MGTIGGFLSSSVGRERPVIKCRLPGLKDTGQEPSSEKARTRRIVEGMAKDPPRMGAPRWDLPGGAAGGGAEEAATATAAGAGAGMSRKVKKGAGARMSRKEKEGAGRQEGRKGEREEGRGEGAKGRRGEGEKGGMHVV